MKLPQKLTQKKSKLSRPSFSYSQDDDSSLNNSDQERRLSTLSTLSSHYRVADFFDMTENKSIVNASDLHLRQTRSPLRTQHHKDHLYNISEIEVAELLFRL
ncbi:hypothetical protein H4219_005355 [Mycoemilia scoparia]|uniref:Uncharacterized protein n=1 Tax=Mycoemilia scoparia TaxID=417184 RepID=A0A9W7ZUA0_9FUNG|nr:hypothetical protein H4219_005355 [Mycoemilia scoparia]